MLEIGQMRCQKWLYMYAYFLLITKNIGILQMTGEVTDTFNEITLFGMVLFWQKAIEFFTKLLQN